MKIKNFTFNVKRKLGSFYDKGDRIAHLTDKMRLGKRYEALMLSEHWPTMKALLDDKAKSAVHKLQERRLSDEDRMEQSARAALIREIYHDLEQEVNRFHLASVELEKIKEQENDR